jgi:hypothetical protein
MGKRKIHGTTYFQCDWTGLPMRQTNCYMPDWNESGKLLKHGSYVCWEAVVAHAMENEEAKRERVLQYIYNLVGCTVQPAPHWSKLSWFARDCVGEIASPSDFLEACRSSEGSVVAVRMLHDGSTHDVICSHTDTVHKFEAHLTRPFNLQGPVHEPQSFQTVRKKSMNKDRDLTVFYWPFKNGLPFNQTASNIFKMQIYGDALLVQQSKEPCFLPRERYINYFEADFHEQYTTKQKRKADSAHFSAEDYSVIKAQMASDLERVEAAASASALVPGRVAMAAVLPSPSGKEIAQLLQARGESAPKKPRLHSVAVEVGS